MTLTEVAEFMKKVKDREIRLSYWQSDKVFVPNGTYRSIARPDGSIDHMMSGSMRYGPTRVMEDQDMLNGFNDYVSGVGKVIRWIYCKLS